MPAAQKATKTKRTPFKPKDPLPAAERLPKLYRALTDQVEGSHFAGAIKTCQKILTLDPQSSAAFQTLLFLHLHTDDYTSALTVLDSSSLASSLDFERSYCLYRLHREKEALEVLQKSNGNGRKEKHLEAQIKYRLGEFEGAQDLYDSLLSSCDPSSSEHPDILENISATSAHLDFISTGYRSHLTAPPSTTDQPRHIPTEGELESYVPSLPTSLPTGWALGGQKPTPSQSQSKQVVKKEVVEKPKSGRRHKLPKGAVEGKLSDENPERWTPMRQRASYMAAQAKKKGVKESMGTGFTQGSTAQQSGGGGGGGGGGNKNKKGKRK